VRLDPARFARVHKSHIVNRDFVKEVQPWSHGDSIVILKNGEQVPLSRRYRANLLG
jgi:DNA-binding LytR/AlgR family response regulator